jgi:ABC-type Fe3+-hydroxamate transport system substrate-binding protein
VVWSSDAWTYVLGDFDLKLPTAPIYNDVVLFDGDDRVTELIADMHPDVIVTSSGELSEYPAVLPLLERSYRPMFSAPPNTVWVLEELAQKPPLSGSRNQSQHALAASVRASDSARLTVA